MPTGETLAKARTHTVDGVPCSINYKSALVTLGTGLVSNDERPKGWKFKGDIKAASLEEIERQVRDRPEFAGLAAGAAGDTASVGSSAPVTSQAPAAADSTGGMFAPIEARRNRRAPRRLQPAELLRNRATGERWKRQPFECYTDEGPCSKRSCIEARARLQQERDEALQLAEQAAVELSVLRDELSTRAELVGAGENVQTGACALQQAALAALDGREECVVRLRLTPSGLGLSVVVFDPDADTLQDQQEAEELEEPQPAPQLSAAHAAAPAAAPRNAFSALMSSGGSMEASIARRQASTSAPAAAEVAVTEVASRVRLTARVATGRALRAALETANRLRRTRKPRQADALLAELAAESTAHSVSAAKGRAQELRNTLFSFGDLKLTQDVVARFLEMPAVRQVLPAALQKQQQRVADSETEQLLIETAKSFFTEIFKLHGKRGRGRRTDVDRNAFAAAAAALLPADLLQNRRGRAAMRLLGLSYRQVKAGSAKRKELEEHGAPRRLEPANTCPPADSSNRHRLFASNHTHAFSLRRPRLEADRDGSPLRWSRL
jgi:hypothetical protein